MNPKTSKRARGIAIKVPYTASLVEAVIRRLPAGYTDGEIDSYLAIACQLNLCPLGLLDAVEVL